MQASATVYFDIGNTNTNIGIGTDKAITASYAIPTNEKQTADQFGLTLLDILRHEDIAPQHIVACIGASVVPGMSSLAQKACQRFIKQPLQLAPEHIAIPLENRYARPHEVGADRLVGAYAARCLYPDAPAIISVDFGTATTFDCVEGNAYLGGLICPGIFSSAKALAQHTAKLPQVSLDVTTTLPQPGTSTATSLSHGFVFGFAAMTEGLCTKLAQNFSSPPIIIGTGGFSTALAKVTSCFHAVHTDLLLDGLRMLYAQHATRDTLPS